MVRVYVHDVNVDHWEQIGDDRILTNSIIELNKYTGDLTLNDGDVLIGQGGPDTHITIADGATVGLADVNITNIDDDEEHQWAGITCAGDATIILIEGTTNNIRGGHYHMACIQPGPSGKTLTIRGDGTLNVINDEKRFGAGIGG